VRDTIKRLEAREEALSIEEEEEEEEEEGTILTKRQILIRAPGILKLVCLHVVS
jgi:hypothetical protein